MTDYEELYRVDPAACGPDPFPEVAAFFDALPVDPPARVLDVGCGQGRDALYAARLGHVVHGLDLSPTGVEQMVSRARRAGWPVTGAAVDVTEAELDEWVDVVLCDRVLHCLPEPDRRRVLARMAACVLPGGYLFVVEPPSGEARVTSFLDREGRWHRQRLRPGFVLAQATR